MKKKEGEKRNDRWKGKNRTQKTHFNFFKGSFLISMSFLDHQSFLLF